MKNKKLSDEQIKQIIAKAKRFPFRVKPRYISLPLKVYKQYLQGEISAEECLKQAKRK